MSLRPTAWDVIAVYLTETAGAGERAKLVNTRMGRSIYRKRACPRAWLAKIVRERRRGDSVVVNHVPLEVTGLRIKRIKIHISMSIGGRTVCVGKGEWINIPSPRPPSRLPLPGTWLSSPLHKEHIIHNNEKGPGPLGPGPGPITRSRWSSVMSMLKCTLSCAYIILDIGLTYEAKRISSEVNLLFETGGVKPFIRRLAAGTEKRVGSCMFCANTHIYLLTCSSAYTRGFFL